MGTLLLPEAVGIELGPEHLGPSKVVALESPGHPGEVLVAVRRSPVESHGLGFR